MELLTGFGAMLALIGIVQKSLSNRYLYGFWELEVGRNPFGPFVNKNHFAGWMVMALPLTLGLLVAGIDEGMRGVKQGWRHHVLWFASPEANRLILVAGAAVLMALSLMLTMSRSGITAFGLSMADHGLVRRARRPKPLATHRCSAVSGRPCHVVVIWSGPDVVASRFAAADWGEFNNRKGAWVDAWSVAREFPVAGTGLNTYWAAALFYQHHEMAYFFAQVHNDYLQLAAEGGLLADGAGDRLSVRLRSRCPRRDARNAPRHLEVASRGRGRVAYRDRVSRDGGIQSADARQRGAFRRGLRDCVAQAEYPGRWASRLSRTRIGLARRAAASCGSFRPPRQQRSRRSTDSPDDRLEVLTDDTARRFRHGRGGRRFRGGVPRHRGRSVRRRHHRPAAECDRKRKRNKRRTET